MKTFALSGAAAYWVVVTVAAVALVSLATLAHHLLERPGIRAGKRLAALLRRGRLARHDVVATEAAGEQVA